MYWLITAPYLEELFGGCAIYFPDGIIDILTLGGGEVGGENSHFWGGEDSILEGRDSCFEEHVGFKWGWFSHQLSW